MALISRVRNLLDMIKFEHTIFALPFAYTGMILAASGLPSLRSFILITLAMVGARTFTMALNRLIDREIDRKNPRTSLWPMSTGIVSVGETLVLCLVSLIVFLSAVYSLPPLCHKLWPVVLLPMVLYSFTKRFTWLCHFFLGLCLGMAPVGAWVAVTGSLPSFGLYSLGLAVLLWTAGFDIIYSCQDHDFDSDQGLFSIPVRFGIKRALNITRMCHASAVLFLFYVGKSFSLGKLYFSGVIVIALFLWYENRLVSPDDLSRINVSFFTINGFVSIFAFVVTFFSLHFRL